MRRVHLSNSKKLFDFPDHFRTPDWGLSILSFPMEFSKIGEILLRLRG